MLLPTEIEHYILWLVICPQKQAVHQELLQKKKPKTKARSYHEVLERGRVLPGYQQWVCTSNCQWIGGEKLLVMKNNTYICRSSVKCCLLRDVWFESFPYNDTKYTFAGRHLYNGRSATQTT